VFEECQRALAAEELAPSPTPRQLRERISAGLGARRAHQGQETACALNSGLIAALYAGPNDGGTVGCHPLRASGASTQEKEVTTMKATFQYARYVLSTLTTIAFGTGLK
jgi:hypothetical protein